MIITPVSQRKAHNRVSLTGEIISEPVFSNEVCHEKFYLAAVAVTRLSGKVDKIPLMISEQLLDVRQNYIGTVVDVTGELRSHNLHDDFRSKLILSVFVKKLRFLEEEPSGIINNQIYLDGVICKPPVFRLTPLGQPIADIFLAVRRRAGRSDYIPCIAWGGNARDSVNHNVAEHVKLCGRIQSREYTKKLSDTEAEKRTAYEVSISTLSYYDPDVDFLSVTC